LLDQLLEMDPQARLDWLSQQTDVDAAVVNAVKRLMVVPQARTNAPMFEQPPKISAEKNADDSPFAVGQTMGPYQLDSRIGVGGMGEVWKAFPSNQLLKRAVALKLTKAGVLDTLLLARFSFERDSLARLNHPNIARLYDAGVDNKQPYLALELVEGIPIHEYCRRNRLNLRDRVMLFTQVLDAVQYAHTNLLIHRDIKPSNILVTPEGQVKLVDFGIAKQSIAIDTLEDHETAATELTQVGHLVYTPRYASPEQFRGQRVSTLTDIYSLGVVLYELLTELSPYAGSNTAGPLQIDASQLDRPVTKPSHSSITQSTCDTLGSSKRILKRTLSDGLDSVVLTAMAKEPPRRYPSARAFSDDLVAWSKGEPVRALPPSKWYFFRKFCGRHPLGLSLGGVALSAVLASTLVALIQANKATVAAQKTTQVTQFLIDMLNANSGRRVSALAAQANRQTTAEQLLGNAINKLKTNTALASDTQANLLGVVGDLTHELQMNDQAIELREKRIVLLTNPEEKTDALLNLSDTLFQAGKTKENDAVLKRARELFGTDLASNLTAKQTLLAAQLQMREGRQLDLSGKYAESTPLLMQASQKLKSLEPPHSDWIEAQRTYLEGLRLNDPKACLDGFEIFISELEQKYGVNSPVLIPNLRSYAANLGRLYEVERAKKVFAKLDAIHAANPNFDAAGALISLSDQAVILRNWGEVVLSNQLIERSLKGFEQLGLQDHPVEPSAVKLSYAASSLSEWDLPNADKNLKQLDHVWRTLSSRPPSLATVLEQLSVSAGYQEDWGGARRYLVEARELREKSLGPTHPTILINDARRVFLEALAGNSEDSFRRYELVFNTPVPASGGLPAFLIGEAKIAALHALVILRLWSRVISDTQQLVDQPLKTPLEKLRRLSAYRYRIVAFTQTRNYALAKIEADKAQVLLTELGGNVTQPERTLLALAQWRLASASGSDAKRSEQMKMQFQLERSKLRSESSVLKQMLALP
jgi:serine/threonine protein kinase/tetratricopeptide (TPR) repeat protein